jgi:hypothetical protein
MKNEIAIVLGWGFQLQRSQAMSKAVKSRGIHWVGAESVASLEWLKKRCGKIHFAFRGGMREDQDELVEWCKAEGISVIVHDLGYLNRADRDGQPGYYQLGLDDIGWVPEESPSPDRFESLDFDLEPLKEGGQGVLVLGQMPGDSQHRLDEDELAAWYRMKVAEVARGPERVIWRPHPRSADMPAPDPSWDVDVPPAPLEESIRGARVVVTFNSTAGLEAIRQGVPVVCSGKAHYAAIAAPGPDGDLRRSYLERLAWAQWTLDEFRDGTAIDFVMKQAGRKLALT